MSDTETGFWDDAPVLSIYTRAQAIEDGVLVDLTPWARKAGIKYPLACTARVNGDVLGRDEEPTNMRLPRLAVLLTTLRTAARTAEGDRIDFTITNTRGATVDLYCVCGPGDDPAPVLTLMFTDED